jgi:hypothetical protein
MDSLIDCAAFDKAIKENAQYDTGWLKDRERLQTFVSYYESCKQLTKSPEAVTITVRMVIDDRPWIAGEGVKFKLRYLEYENDELGISTGTIDLHDVIVSEPMREIVSLDSPEAIDRVALAIYFADPNFYGWGAIEKDRKYLDTDPAREQKLERAKAAIAEVKKILNKSAQCHGSGSLVGEVDKQTEGKAQRGFVNIDIIREALEFYADANHITDDVLQTNKEQWNMYCEESEPPFYVEMGYKAEKALKEIEVQESK